MSFNTALTGIRAANTDLEVSGNNIANASTVGFKESRVEFADVYANSVVGSGTNAVGNGVRVSDVAQQFSQGNIGFTSNPLDLAINGSGFFLLNDQGSQIFTRAGQFGVNSDGFIVNNSGAILQGFIANSAGDIGGVATDIQLETVNITPQHTTNLEIDFNLDQGELPPEVRGNTLNSNGVGVGVVQVGSALNGYTAGALDVNGITYNIPSSADLSAGAIVGELSAIPEVTSASATTTVTFAYTPSSGTAITGGELRINNQSITGINISDVATSINALTGITAVADVPGGTISIVHNQGDNLSFDLTGGASGLSVDINGSTIQQGTANEIATVGGAISLNLEDGITLTNGTSNVFTATPITTPFAQNTFDPSDSGTYNWSTTQKIFDSLGSLHSLEFYFVKEPAVSAGDNTWSMYVQVDGQDVGDPDPNAADPTAATRAQYTLRFNEDGVFDSVNSDQVLVSNWLPLDADGNYNGSFTPLNVASGGTLPIALPSTNSNFQIDVSGATQFASESTVYAIDQNGFPSGELASIDIDETGIIFARYSNGEAEILGQVALADFRNQQGLTPIGDTSWAESFESGPAVIGAPRSATLGAVQSGALEDSNVELAEELVSLIIAQRNFQANARTIETANEVTQTVINLR